MKRVLEAIIVKTVGQALNLGSLEQHDYIQVLFEVGLPPWNMANGGLFGQLPLRPCEFCLVEGEVACVVV